MARPMKPGRHASPDRSFSRSTGSAALRGGALLAVAIVLGIVLLNTSDDGPNVTTVTIPTVASGAPDTALGVESSTTLGTGTTIASGPTPTITAGRSPSDVRVLVANGSKIKGAAAAGSEKLRPAGYTLLPAADAQNKPQENHVYFVVGYEAEAADIASRLGIASSQVAPLPVTPPVDDLNGANILVIISTGLASTLTSATTP